MLQLLGNRKDLRKHTLPAYAFGGGNRRVLPTSAEEAACDHLYILPLKDDARILQSNPNMARAFRGTERRRPPWLFCSREREPRFFYFSSLLSER